MIEDPRFTRLGFGVTGPHAGLAVSRGATQDMIKAALDAGASFFDTGPAYGRGEGEKRLGTAIRAFGRDKFFVCTKAGIGTDRRRDFSAGGVEMSIKASLARLKTEHIDLLLLHGASAEELTPRLIRRLNAFKERGMLRHIGVCGRGSELDAAIELGVFDAMMAPLNPTLDETMIDRLRRAKAAGMSVIGIEIMAGVRRRSGIPLSMRDLWYLARATKQKLTGNVPATHELDAPAALGWALEQDCADAVVCLSTRPAHIAANAAVAGLEAGPAIA
jgi:aryl-alcohol dehydrogenase-like predicted oxidoreductase